MTTASRSEAPLCRLSPTRLADLPLQTPCGFTPIRLEPEYTGPHVSAVRVIPLYYASAAYVTSFYDVTGTSTVCLLGSTAPTTTYTTVGIETATVTTAFVTGPTAFAACKPNNVVTRGPEGGIINNYFFLPAGYNATDFDVNSPGFYSRPFSPGVAASPEECCNYCHSQPVCYGSTWMAHSYDYAPVIRNGTCTAYLPNPDDPAPVCDLTATAVNFYHDDFPPVFGAFNQLAVS